MPSDSWQFPTIRPAAILALALGATPFCGLCTAALADSATTPDLAAQVAALRAQVAELKAKDDQNYLNEQRTEEIKGLIRDALADADTRASLAADGATSGNDGKFFIKTADDSFRLNIGAQIQVRYTATLRPTKSAPSVGSDSSGHEDGFSLPRVEPTFNGYIGSPRFDYNIILKADRRGDATHSEFTKIAEIGYKFDLGGEQGDAQYVRVFGGRIYDRFSRESLMSSAKQQTVDRSAVDNILAANDDIVQGVGVEWNPLPEYLRIAATYNNGIQSGTEPPPSAGVGTVSGLSHDFNNANADYSFTARADVKIVGDWKETQDVESWSTASDLQAFVGGGYHYEAGRPGDGAILQSNYHYFSEWTADTLLKFKGLGVLGSFYGVDFSTVGPSTYDGVSVGKAVKLYGATAQAGYLIADKVEPFVRYEWLFPDAAIRSNQLNLVTTGVNYFFKKHAAKFTLDTVWVFNNVNSANTLGTDLTGIGITTQDPGRKNEVVIRAQFQILF